MKLNNPTPTLASKTSKISAKLGAVGIENALLDARWLIGHALGLARADWLTQAGRTLTEAETQAIDRLVARRAAHEPVGRILGEREFWSLPFGLNEATLEPRPDSETLVEVTLKFLRDRITPRILDLGTGSGCLLLSLLHELLTATGVGIDVTPRAVEQAQKNAERLGLASRAVFRTGNWLEGVTEKFDAILSNPPYIPAADIEGLMPEVRNHDPLLALDGGYDGLDVYRLLAPQIQQFLKPDGLVVFELGMGQADAVADLCRKAGLQHATKHRDLSGVERCVTATLS